MLDPRASTDVRGDRRATLSQTCNKAFRNNARSLQLRKFDAFHRALIGFTHRVRCKFSVLWLGVRRVFSGVASRQCAVVAEGLTDTPRVPVHWCWDFMSAVGCVVRRTAWRELQMCQRRTGEHGGDAEDAHRPVKAPHMSSYGHKQRPGPVGPYLTHTDKRDSAVATTQDRAPPGSHWPTRQNRESACAVQR